MVQVGWGSKHGRIVLIIISYIFRGTNSTRISTMTSLLTLSSSIFDHITQHNKRVYCGSIWTRISDDISSFASLKWLKIKSTDQVKGYVNDVIMKSHHRDKKHLKKIFSGVYSIHTCYYRGQLSPQKIFKKCGISRWISKNV